MKKLLLTVLATAALSLPLCAQTAKFSVPFEFAIGSTTAPAGQYEMKYEAGSAALKVESIDQGAAYFVNARPQSQNSSGEYKLVFNAYGSQYFLSQIWIGASKSNVPMSRVERELQKSKVTASQPVVLAMR